MSNPEAPKPATAVSRLRDKQVADRESLDALLDSTPLATVAFVRDGVPVALPVGFVRVGDELVVHGSTGSPWLRHLANGVPASGVHQHTGRRRGGAQRFRILLPLPQRGAVRQLRRRYR